MTTESVSTNKTAIWIVKINSGPVVSTLTSISATQIRTQRKKFQQKQGEDFENSLKEVEKYLGSIIIFQS